MKKHLLILFTLTTSASHYLSAQTNVFSKVYYSNVDGVNGTSVVKAFDSGFMISGIYNYALPTVLKVDSAGTLLWTKGFTTSTSYMGNFQKIIQTNDTNFLALGCSRGATNSDVFCVKINPSGDTLWSKLIHTENNSYPFDVQQTVDHGYIITGYSDLPTTPNSRIIALKLDSAGNVQWNKNFTVANSQNRGHCVKQTPDGGYIIGALAESAPPKYDDAVIIKLTSTGIFSWAKSYNHSSHANASLNDIAILPDGLLVYMSLSNMARIVKTDFSGNVIWSRSPGIYCPLFYDQTPKLHTTSDGGHVSVNGNGNGGSPAQLLKIDSTGNTQFVKTLYMEATDVIEANDTGLFVLGNGPLLGVSPHSAPTGNPQIGAIKTDSLGNEPFCLNADSFSNTLDTLFATNVTPASATLGTGLYAAPFLSTKSLMIYNGCVDFLGGVNELDESGNISVHPNPFTSETTLTFEQEHSDCTLKIINVLGKEVYNAIIPGSTTNFTIEKGNLNPGIYFIQVQTDKGTTSKKIIIQ